jgi:dUTP pyrophosphatase
MHYCGKGQKPEDEYTPQAATQGSAAVDLKACLEKGGLVIAPHETVKIPTGLKMAIPQGYAGFLYARSGLATKHGVAPANCVGVIDSDYRGEVIVALHNRSDKHYFVEDGLRIAQLVVSPVVAVTAALVPASDETARGESGFSSTGT